MLKSWSGPDRDGGEVRSVRAGRTIVAVDEYQDSDKIRGRIQNV